MSVSPNKYGVMIGAKSALLLDAAVTSFSKNIHLIPHNANIKSFDLGLNRSILIRDAGAVSGEESTNSTVFDFTLHIACIDAKGDLSRMAATARVMAAARDVCEELDGNTGIYATATEWIETAKATEVPATEEIWGDLVEQVDKTPFVMAAAVVKYQIYCLEV